MIRVLGWLTRSPLLLVRRQRRLCVQRDRKQYVEWVNLMCDDPAFLNMQFARIVRAERKQPQ